jgi:phage terminase large subunit-like protein
MGAEPRYATPRTDRETYGHEVAKLARLLGFDPMPHQRLFWDLALEHENGKLAYREVGWTISRQNGKSVALLCLMLWRCLKWPGQVVRYGAQTGVDARGKLCDDWHPLLEHSPLAEVLSFRRQSGHEALMFDNGSRLGLVASSEKSGHGSTLDSAVLDESWAHADHRLEQSCRPAMVTRENAQMFVVSTAGTETRSPFLYEKVQAGRHAAEAGITEGIAYLEWSADPDADPGSPDTWRATIPALGITISEETIRGDFHGMPRHEFERSFLNMWTSTMGDALIDTGHWETLAEPNAGRPEWVVLGVDIAPQGKSASIVAVGEDGDLLRLAVLEHGPNTDWVVGALSRIREEYGEPHLMVDEKACGALLPELERVTDFHLTALRTAQVPPACDFFLRMTRESRLRHRGERELLTAIDGAAERKLGDGFAWSRRNSGCDITPLVAATVAVSFWLGAYDGGEP